MTVVSGQLPLASTPDHYEFLVSSFRRPFTDRERMERWRNHLKRQITRMLSGHDSNYYYRHHAPAPKDSLFREWSHTLLFVSFAVFFPDPSLLVFLSSFECDLPWQRCAHISFSFLDATRREEERRCLESKIIVRDKLSTLWQSSFSSIIKKG